MKTQFELTKIENGKAFAKIVPPLLSSAWMGAKEYEVQQFFNANVRANEFWVLPNEYSSFHQNLPIGSHFKGDIVNNKIVNLEV